MESRCTCTLLMSGSNVEYEGKGVGEGGAAGACAPTLSKVVGHKWVLAPPPPPHFWTDHVF